MSIGVCKSDSDVDWATLDGEETYVYVAILKSLVLLVVRVHIEDVLIEIAGFTVTFFRLFVFLADIDAQVFINFSKLFA